MNKPKRDYTPEAKKALEILGAFLSTHPRAEKTLQVYRMIEDYRYLDDEHLPIAEKYIRATIRMESANK